MPKPMGAHQWTQWGHGGSPVNLANVGQDWYRNPGWGAHVVWNPQYGYQDYLGIEDIYSQAQGPMNNQAFQQAFSQAGYKPQTEGGWGTHYGNDPAHPLLSHQDKMMNQYGVPYNPYGAGAQQGGYGQQYQQPQQQPQQPQQQQQQQHQQPYQQQPAVQSTIQQPSQQQAPQAQQQQYQPPQPAKAKKVKNQKWWR